LGRLEPGDLEKKLDIQIIGKNRKPEDSLSRDFLTQRLTIKGREYIYRYYELGFTQPNPEINIKMVDGL